MNESCGCIKGKFIHQIVVIALLYTGAIVIQYQFTLWSLSAMKMRILGFGSETLINITLS
jgi:hypothetical protein